MFRNRIGGIDMQMGSPYFNFTIKNHAEVLTHTN